MVPFDILIVRSFIDIIGKGIFINVPRIIRAHESAHTAAVIALPFEVILLFILSPSGNWIAFDYITTTIQSIQQIDFSA